MGGTFILIICTVVLIILLLFGWWWGRKRLAIKKVRERSDGEKLKDINEALSIYGFLFDVEQDIVYSSMYPLQRKLGYCRLYDEFAPSVNIIMHCEPIYFQYDGRQWLIEFWKGQYGMTTGGEIGVYVSDNEDLTIPGIFSGPFYESVSDQEFLQMKYILKKEGKQIIEREGRHWWLTGFDVGTFTKPEQLSLEVQITFPNWYMLDAFVGGLNSAGYTDEEVSIEGTMVHIIFTNPKTEQPKKYSRWLIAGILKLNRFYCNLFNWVTKDFTRTIDKIDYLRIRYPILFGIIANRKGVNKLEKFFAKGAKYPNEQKRKKS